MKRVKSFLLMLLLGIVVALCHFLFPAVGNKDSIAFWAGANLYLQGENPYDESKILLAQREIFPEISEPQRFLNAPWSLPLMCVIWGTNFTAGKILLSFLTALVMYWSARECEKWYGPLGLYYKTLYFLFFPFVTCLAYGQLSGALLAGVLLLYSAVLNPSEKTWWKYSAGMYLCAIKPQSAYLLMLVVSVWVWQRWKNEEKFKAAIALSPLLLFSWYELDLYKEWAMTFSYSSQWRTAVPMTYLRDLFERCLFIDSKPLLWVVPLCAVLGALLFLRRRLEPSFHTLLFFTLLSVVMAPYGWVYDFSALSPVFWGILVATSASQEVLKKSGLLAVVLLLVLPIHATWTTSFEGNIAHLLTLIVGSTVVFKRNETV